MLTMNKVQKKAHILTMSVGLLKSNIVTGDHHKIARSGWFHLG